MEARDIIVTILLLSCDAVLEERKARRSNQRESRAPQAQTIDMHQDRHRLAAKWFGMYRHSTQKRASLIE